MSVIHRHIPPLDGKETSDKTPTPGLTFPPHGQKVFTEHQPRKEVFNKWVYYPTYSDPNSKSAAR